MHCLGSSANSLTAGQMLLLKCGARCRGTCGRPCSIAVHPGRGNFRGLCTIRVIIMCSCGWGQRCMHQKTIGSQSLRPPCADAHYSEGCSPFVALLKQYMARAPPPPASTGPAETLSTAARKALAHAASAAAEQLLKQAAASARAAPAAAAVARAAGAPAGGPPPGPPAVARKPRRAGQAEQKRRAGTALQLPRTALQRARRLAAAAGVVCRGLQATSARAACGLRPTTRGRRAGPGPAWLRGRAWARQAWPGHCAACQAQSRQSDAKSFEHFMSLSCTEMSLHRLPTCVRRLSVGRMC